MTICVFYVNPQTPNIENFDASGGLWSPGGISLFSHQISRRMASESCLGPIFDLSYDHLYKCDHFGNKCVYIYIYEGREKGKGKREEKKGREKGKGKREGKKGSPPLTIPMHGSSPSN